jgi:hypothetical protein
MQTHYAVVGGRYLFVEMRYIFFADYYRDTAVDKKRRRGLNKYLDGSGGGTLMACYFVHEIKHFSSSPAKMDCGS